jgi:hypothetical protein
MRVFFMTNNVGASRSTFSQSVESVKKTCLTSDLSLTIKAVFGLAAVNTLRPLSTLYYGARYYCNHRFPAIKFCQTTLSCDSNYYHNEISEERKRGVDPFCVEGSGMLPNPGDVKTHKEQR